MPMTVRLADIIDELVEKLEGNDDPPVGLEAADGDSSLIRVALARLTPDPGNPLPEGTARGGTLIITQPPHRSLLEGVPAADPWRLLLDARDAWMLPESVVATLPYDVVIQGEGNPTLEATEDLDGGRMLELSVGDTFFQAKDFTLDGKGHSSAGLHIAAGGAPGDNDGAGADPPPPEEAPDPGAPDGGEGAEGFGVVGGRPPVGAIGPGPADAGPGWEPRDGRDVPGGWEMPDGLDELGGQEGPGRVSVTGGPPIAGAPAPGAEAAGDPDVPAPLHHAQGGGGHSGRVLLDSVHIRNIHQRRAQPVARALRVEGPLASTEVLECSVTRVTSAAAERADVDISGISVGPAPAGGRASLRTVVRGGRVADVAVPAAALDPRQRGLPVKGAGIQVTAESDPRPDGADVHAEIVDVEFTECDPGSVEAQVSTLAVSGCSFRRSRFDTWSELSVVGGCTATGNSFVYRGSVARWAVRAPLSAVSPVQLVATGNLFDYSEAGFPPHNVAISSPFSCALDPQAPELDQAIDQLVLQGNLVRGVCLWFAYLQAPTGGTFVITDNSVDRCAKTFLGLFGPSDRAQAPAIYSGAVTNNASRHLLESGLGPNAAVRLEEVAWSGNIRIPR